MSTVATVYCDSASCSVKGTVNGHGWISLNQGAARYDLCSWPCVVSFAKNRWQPSSAPSQHKPADKPVIDVHGAPYLRDAVQPPLPDMDKLIPLWDWDKDALRKRARELGVRFKSNTLKGELINMIVAASGESAMRREP